MKVTITFDDATIDEAARLMNVVRAIEAPKEATTPAAEGPTQDPGGHGGPVVQPAAVAPAKPKRQYPNGKPTGRPARALPPVEAPQEPAAPAVDPVPSPVDEQAPDAAAPTEAQAKAALEQVFEAKGFAGAQQLLQKVNAARLRDVPADKYGELIAEAAKLAKGE